MKWMTTCALLALTPLATGCAPIGPTDPCAGWSRIEGTAPDANTISDRLALSIASHNEQGRRMGCWK